MWNTFCKKKVMVLDGEWPSALAIVRSLGKKGIPVSVGSRRPQSLAAKSKYCSDHFIYPDPLFDVAGFRKTLLEHVHPDTYELMIPVTDLTICPIMKIRHQVEAIVPIAMAPNDKLAVVLSKGLTGELAKANGIPIPRTWTLRDVQELGEIKEHLSFPVVIKPDSSKSWISDKIGKDLSVTYAFDFDELVKKAASLLEWNPVIIQQYVKGEGVGMAVLSEEGKIQTAFQYRRIHEVPLSGGTSSYRVSESIVPEMEDYVSRLVSALSWNGIAMIEFKRDQKTGDLYLLEINGRFWGSLPLAVASGADFPYYLYEFMVRKRRDFPKTYKIEKRCRNIQKELEWLKTVLVRKEKVNPIIKYPTYNRILIDFFRFLNPSESSDTLSIFDPLPGLQDIFDIWGSFIGYAKKRMIFKREFRRMKYLKKNPKILFEIVDHSETILFVCSGNVIRSPFAARYLEQLLNGKKKSLLIDSAGLDTVPDRKVHPNMIKKAKEIGLNMESHRAIPISDEMVRKADIILVMEIKHLVMVKQQYADSLEKTFLLGCFSEDNLMDVPDPDLGSDAVFESCIRQIKNSVKKLALRLDGNLGTI